MSRIGLLVAAICCATSASASPNSFVNFETPPVHPLEMTPDGSKLLAVNTADGRLEVFSLASGSPVWTASIPVGIDPVTVRARTNTEAWVVNLVSDDVSIVNLTTLNVAATLAIANEPNDVVFAGAPQRAFVSVAGLNQVRVYDPANLGAAPIIINIQGQQPRAMATDGTRVYAAIFFAGNRSQIVPSSIVSQPDGPEGGANPPFNNGNSFNPPLNPALPTPPPVALIVNRETTPQGEKWKDDNGGLWDAKVTWGLNQNAIAVISVSNLSVNYVRNIGTLQFSLAIQPGTNKLTVGQLYTTNEARFETTMRARFAKQRLALFDPVNSTGQIFDLNPHLFANPPNPTYKTSVTPAEQHMSLADARGVVWNTAGTFVYVSGMDSNNIARYSLGGNPFFQRQATIDVGQGPTGLTYDGPRNRLYCLNRFEGNISVINASNDTEILPRVPFFDPTPAAIKLGRPMLYDSHATSKLGQASCASCHIDASVDMQGWDLGDPSGSMAAFVEPCFNGIAPSGTCADWHPMKGPMMTQTLAGIIGLEPLHWRGDRHNIQAFSAGFTGLLDLAAPPAQSQMDQLGDFLVTVRFAPNPNRTINDGLPASVSGYSGDPASGQAIFNSPILNGGTVSCTTCHSGPTGEQSAIVSATLLNESQGVKIPHLREAYRKTGFSYASTTNNKGYGYLHDGSADNIFNLLANHVFPFPGADQQRRDLEAFLVCFSTGTHPAVGVQATFNGANNNDATLTALVGTITALADSGVVGLVAHGVAAGQQRGYAYIPALGAFQSDRAAQTISAAALRQSAAAGGEVTFTVVVAGTEIRIGIDRDEDGFFDQDEIDLGSNPADASSRPYPRGDMNLDHFVTVSDVPLFVDVMLDPSAASIQQRSQADMTIDSVDDGRDVQLFVQAILGG